MNNFYKNILIIYFCFSFDIEEEITSAKWSPKIPYIMGLTSKNGCIDIYALTDNIGGYVP